MRGVIFLLAVLCAANAAAVVKLGSLQDWLLVLFLADVGTALMALYIAIFFSDEQLR